MSEAIGTREFAEKYGVTQATVSKWCREGKIPNCNQDGKGSPWHIPKDAVPPVGYKQRKKWYWKGAAYESRSIQSTIFFRKLLPNHLHPINLCTDIVAPSAGGRLLQAVHPHISQRENLVSFLCFIVLSGEGELSYEEQTYQLGEGDCVFVDCRKAYSHLTSDNLWSLQWCHFYAPSLPAVYSSIGVWPQCQ